MKTHTEERIRNLREGLREWKARISLAEHSQVGLVGRLRRQLDHRMSTLRSAVKLAEAAPAERAEPRVAEAEDAWIELLEFWDRSLPDACPTMTRTED